MKDASCKEEGLPGGSFFLVPMWAGCWSAYGTLGSNQAMKPSSHTRMRALRTGVFVAIACSIACKSLYGQGGCLDSPEAPTDVLMGVGVVGMFYGSSIAMKVLRRIRAR
jgi:XrtJ-associated TM-motif-TM protein